LFVVVNTTFELRKQSVDEFVALLYLSVNNLRVCEECSVFDGFDELRHIVAGHCVGVPTANCSQHPFCRVFQFLSLAKLLHILSVVLQNLFELVDEHLELFFLLLE
jgi:hypothetical protein